MLTILTFFLASAFAQTSPAPWEVVSTTVRPAPALEMGVRQLPLDLFVEEDSRWERDNALEKELVKTSGILRQCGIVLGEVRITSVRWTAETIRILNTSNPYKGPEELILVQDLAPVPRTTGFLFSNVIPSTASAFNQDSVRRLSAGSQVSAVPLAETFHITEQWIDYKQVPGALPSYSTFAHEIVHLAGNLGHIDVRGNLMSNLEGRGAKSSGLTREQCQAMAAYPLLRN